jgi:predicted Na+-dependent transporter
MKYLHRYFGLLLILCCLAGLVVPSAGKNTSLIVIVALGFIIFCSFFQVEFSREALRSGFGISVKFYFLRFVLLPVAVYFAFGWISDFYAPVLLLSFLLPAAVSSPSFALLFGGRFELSLKLLLMSSFLSVLTIPFLMSLLLGSSVDIRATSMLMTLVYTIVIPFLLHLPLRSSRRIKSLAGRYNTLLTLIGLGVMFVVITARNKPEIVANPGLVGLFMFEAMLLYTLLYLAGYYLFPSQPKEIRRTLSISSGANNIGLGVTITTLFFPGEMNIFFIVSQLVWIVMLIPLRRSMNHKL